MTKKGTMLVVLLLLLGIGGYYFLGHKNSGKKSEINNETSNEVNSLDKEKEGSEFSDIKTTENIEKIETGEDYMLFGEKYFGKYTDFFESNASEMPDGEHLEYYDNGNIKLKCNYESGRLDGEFLSYHENEKIWEERHYIKGNRDGDWTVYTNDGKVLLKESYKNGKRDGSYNYYTPEESKEWVNDIFGSFLSISSEYRDGELQSSSIYDFGVTTIEKLDGKGNYEKSQGEEGSGYIHNFKNGKLEGEGLDYYMGDIVAQYNFKNGKLDGKYDQYYIDAGIYIKSNYKNGKLDGEYTRYYDNENIEIKSNYKNGNLEGKYVEYLENGNVALEHFYSIKEVSTDQKDTKHFEYYRDGKLYLKEDYKNEELDGKSTKFSEDGNLYREENYKNGALDGESISYFSDGKISLREFYKEGSLVGDRIYYEEDGTILAKLYYRDNLRIK